MNFRKWWQDVLIREVENDDNGYGSMYECLHRWLVHKVERMKEGKWRCRDMYRDMRSVSQKYVYEDLVKEMGYAGSFNDYICEWLDINMAFIRRELSAVMGGQLLWNNVTEKGVLSDHHIYDVLFPETVYPAKGLPISVELDEADRVLKKINEETLIVPWDRRRFMRSYERLKHESWQFDPYNHEGIFYEEMELVLIYNGRHSVMSGVLLNNIDEVPVFKISLEEIFPHLQTNGTYWQHGEHLVEGRKRVVKTERVIDYRMALLYQLAKWKWELRTKGDMTPPIQW